MWPVSLLTVADDDLAGVGGGDEVAVGLSRVLLVLDKGLDSRKAMTMSAPRTIATHRQLRSGPSALG